MAEPIKMPFGLWTRVGPIKHVLPGKCDWTIHVQRQCGLFVRLLWPFVIFGGPPARSCRL